MAEGHRQRVKREFLESGFTGWSEHRVLEMLLFYAVPRGDVNDLAHRLIDHFGSFAGVCDADFTQLMEVPGVGEHSATLIRMISSMGAVYLASRNRGGTVVNTCDQARVILEPCFYGKCIEEVYILCLDCKNQVLGVRRIGEGSINNAAISLRRITEEAIKLRAAKIYLSHNHVGSLAIPSAADLQSTVVTYDVINNVGIKLVDHLIFMDGEMISLKSSRQWGHYF